MREIMLTHDDCIESVLPMVEEAMENGEICRIRHLDYLGLHAIAVLVSLTRANCLMDSTTGKLLRSQPGFGLVSVDDSGVARTLA